MEKSKNEIYGIIIIMLITIFVVINSRFGTVETNPFWHPVINIEFDGTQIVNQTNSKLLRINMTATVINGTITIQSFALQPSDIQKFGDTLFYSDLETPLALESGEHRLNVTLIIPLTIEEKLFLVLVDYTFLRGQQVVEGTGVMSIYFD